MAAACCVSPGDARWCIEERREKRVVEVEAARGAAAAARGVRCVLLVVVVVDVAERGGDDDDVSCDAGFVLAVDHAVSFSCWEVVKVTPSSSSRSIGSSSLG